MYLFDFLNVLNPDIRPDQIKIHLASWNGREHPIDVYLAGRFEEWQRWQNRKNFEQPCVVALISLPGTDKWLFGGVFHSHGCEWKAKREQYYYDLTEDPACKEMNGRLVSVFRRTGRASYLRGENWKDKFLVSEIYPKRLTIGEFPGYKGVNISKGELDLIVSQGLPSWRTALSNVAGIYLISDQLGGQLYVGSASGEGGIWQRWCAYAANGHGGNAELRKLLKTEGPDRAREFRYSILEIADIHMKEDDILQRESHWKNILMSRSHGLNAN